MGERALKRLLGSESFVQKLRNPSLPYDCKSTNMYHKVIRGYLGFTSVTQLGPSLASFSEQRPVMKPMGYWALPQYQVCQKVLK